MAGSHANDSDVGLPSVERLGSPQHTRLTDLSNEQRMSQPFTTDTFAILFVHTLYNARSEELQQKTNFGETKPHSGSVNG